MTTRELKNVFLATVVYAAALRETVVDAQTAYQSDLAAAVSEYVHGVLLDRGVSDASLDRPYSSRRSRPDRQLCAG